MSPVNPQRTRQRHQIQDNPSQSTPPNVTLKDALDKLYEDIESAPSFSAKIDAYLRSNTVHSRHRRIIKKNFPRRKIIARFPFEIFMADLLEYPQYKFQNNRYVFALILIDCFTKKVWTVPMKRKDSQWTADAFESIFRTFDQFPVHIITDRGLGKLICYISYIIKYIQSFTIIKFAKFS